MDLTLIIDSRGFDTAQTSKKPKTQVAIYFYHTIKYLDLTAMAYACLKQEIYQDQDHYQICAVRPEDVEKIRQWRNAQINVLRQNALISPEDQLQYYQTYVWPTFTHEKPPQILFSFFLQENCIGYGGLTHIDWENARAEISFLVDPFRAQDPDIYSKDFYHFLNMLCHVAFEHLQLHRLFTEAYAFRFSTIDILEKYGFKKEGVLRQHVFKNGQWVDSIMQGLLVKDWHPIGFFRNSL